MLGGSLTHETCFSTNILAKADDTEQLMYIEIDVKEISHIRAGKDYTQLRRTELYK